MKSLQSKIALTMWLISALSTLATAFLVGSLLIRSHQESIHQQLQATGASLIALGISDFSELQDFEILNIFVEDALKMEKVDKIVRIFDTKRKLVFTSLDMEHDKLTRRLPERIDKPTFWTVAVEDQNYETLVLPYQIGNRKKTFYLQVAIPLPKYFELFSALGYQSLVLLVGLFTISLAISRALARRLSQPILKISQQLENLNPEQIESFQELKIEPRAEYLGAIVKALNLLMERTRRAILEMKKMSRYVAHEMRTPLTILQGEAEMALHQVEPSREQLEKVLRSSLEEVGRMSRIVDTVLQIAEPSRAKAAYQPLRIELADWIQENLPFWERTLGGDLHWVPPAHSPEVSVDPQLLFRLIDNLVRNVRYHTPPGTYCAISLTVEDKIGRLSVEDRGPPLPQSVVDQMNQAERVLETQGVGLNLCHVIAQLCSIRLKFSARIGGGLKADLDFDASMVYESSGL